MSIVNLTVKTHRVVIHPVLNEHIPEEFLDPLKHSSALLKKLNRSREHLASDRPVVVKTGIKNQYYVICPVFAAMIRKHEWEAFDGMTIPAIVVVLSDDEVEEYFWSNVRSAFSYYKVYSDIGISIFDLFGERPADKTKPRALQEIRGFNAEVDSFNQYRDESIASEKSDSDQHNLWGNTPDN